MTKKEASTRPRLAAALQKKEHRIWAIGLAVLVIGALMVVWDWLGEKPQPPSVAPASGSSTIASKKAQEADKVQSLAPTTVLPQMEPDPTRPWEHYEQVAENEFPLMSFGLRGTPLTDQESEQVASLSLKYRMTEGGFRKQDLLQAMQGKFQQRMQAFSSRYFVLNKEVYLGPYDREEKSFPLRPDAAQEVPWSLEGHWATVREGNFDLVVSNMDSFDHYAVADEKTARRLDGLPVSKRNGHAKIYLFAEDVSPDGRVVTARIRRIVLTDYDGKPMGELRAAQ